MNDFASDAPTPFDKALDNHTQILLEYAVIRRLASLSTWELNKAIRAGKIAFLAFATHCDSLHLVKRARQLRKNLKIMGYTKTHEGSSQL